MKYLPGGMMSDAKPPAQQAIKEENLKRIFLDLHRRGEMTRVQLSRSTGLSAATVSALVDELVRLGLFIETGPAKTDHIGRKPINLRIRPESRLLPVIALNRWGAQLVVYDLNLRPMETVFVPHASDQYGGFEGEDPESDGNPDTGTDYAVLLRGALEKSRVFDPARAIAVCVVSPGIFVQERDAYSLSALHVSFSRAVMADLERDIKVPLFFGNSSMAHAYAEKKVLDSMGETVNDLMYIYVRDGVGAGILCGGDLFLGAEETAGEIGHVTINSEGKRCVCGNRGCLEQYVNVDTILERVRRAIGEDGDSMTLESIGAAYDAGHAAVVRVVDDIAEKLFRGIYSAICLTGIKRIVIGGGIERLGDTFLKKLRSFTEENGGRMLMRNVTIDVTRSGATGDSLGIANYFLDKVFSIAT